LSRLLLDTTFLVNADRSGSALAELIDDEDEVAIAAVTVAELRVGVLLATPKKRATRLAFLDDVLGAIPVVDYDTSVAESHAELLAHVRQQGKPRGAHDLLIAATAKATQRLVVSADVTAFADLPGVEVRTHR
jgi:tRNA(fMet)-specific endonuclease VapC